AVPQKSYADQARGLARRALALETLRRKAKAGQVQVSAEQLDELDDKFQAASRELEGACRSIYTQILLPVRGRVTDEPIAFRLVELGTLAGTGADLHARILELLKKHVFTEITVERFVELIGVDDNERQQYVALTEALDSFFSLLDRPKMRSDAPLLAALATA